MQKKPKNYRDQLHANITKHHTKRTGMNTIYNLLLKQIMPLSHRTLKYKLVEKLMLINHVGITIKDHRNNSWLLIEQIFPMNKNLVVW